MASIFLNVPVVAQEMDNSCWHTAAYMIWLYWQKNGKGSGPMNTVGPAYENADTDGLSPGDFITLAQKVGLSALDGKNFHSDNDLAGYLKSSGPVWCAGYWFGAPHIIVLTGMSQGTVYFNDPDGGVKKHKSVKWFNEKLASQYYGCLMVKDAGRY